jgi:hypothetical protein
MKLKNISEVRETDFGVFYWVDGKNRPVVDTEGNNLCVYSHRNDRTKIEALKKAARYWGIEDGHAVFQEGTRPVSAAEYETQVQRLAAGEEPDPFSHASVAEIAKGLGYKFK